jgi:type IV secretion system protein VirD4
MSFYPIHQEVNMKWTHWLALPFLLCLSCSLLLLVAPIFWLAFLHAGLPGWLSHLRAWLLPGGDPVSDLVHYHLANQGALLSQPYTWVLLGCMGALLPIAYLHMQFTFHSTTFGSAGYASKRQARSFHTRRRFQWRLPRFLFRGPVKLVSTTAQTIGTAQHNARLRRTGLASQFLVGSYHGRLMALSEKQQEEHLLIVAPTGSGKSSLEIIPNLLREQGSRSLFIADLKNELYRITAGALARSHQVWWFNPTRPQRSHGYNPLAYVKDAMDANMLADCWVKNTGESEKDPFWSTCARHLISAIILHLRATEPDAPFSRLADYILEHSFEELKDLLANSPSQAARRKTGAFLKEMNRNDRLVGAVMTDIGNRFQLFDSDAIRRVTAINEIDFHVMIDDPTALYLSIPRSEVDLYRPLLACFTMQMFRAFEQRAANAGRLPRGIACYMDEFANIGYIPGYAHFVSTARYLRVALIMVIQNFAQLDERYGPHAAETIRENANTHLLLPGAGLRECTFYSERIGDTTVKTWTRSRRGGRDLWGVADETWTEAETRRRLLTPEELRTMPARTVLMLRSALPPMLLTATPYYEDGSLAHLVNLPHQVTHIHRQPPKPPAAAQTPPPRTTSPQPAIIVEADAAKNDDQQHFL